jgi:hypothetical protein
LRIFFLLNPCHPKRHKRTLERTLTFLIVFIVFLLMEVSGLNFIRGYIFFTLADLQCDMDKSLEVMVSLL